MAWEYRRIPLPPADYAVYDAVGTAGPYDGNSRAEGRYEINVREMLAGPPTAPVSDVLAYVDLPAARSWLARLDQLINDAATVAAADRAADAATDYTVGKWLEAANAFALGWPDASAYLVHAQEAGPDPFVGHRYVFAIFEAISNIYNAMNIMWHNDPEARALYRAMLAGPPDSESPLRALYGSRDARDYNNNWYRPNDEFPTGMNQQGVIPAKAREQYLRFMGPQNGPTGVNAAETPCRFFQFIGIRAQIGNAERYRAEGSGTLGSRSKVEYASDTVNAPWGACYSRWIDGSTYRRWSGVDLWEKTPGIRNNRAVDVYISEFFNGAPFQHCRNEAGSPVLGLRARADWRNFWYGDGGHVAAPIKAYLEWASLWLALLQSRTPDQIILGSRAYVIRQNTETMRLAESRRNLFAQAVDTDTDAALQRSASNPTLSMVSTILPIVGTAVGSVFGPVGGAIGGLIGGAASMAVKFIDIATPADVTGLFKDDLGRWKPIYERGWAGGNPVPYATFQAAQDKTIYWPGFLVPMAPVPAGSSPTGRRRLLSLEEITRNVVITPQDAARLINAQTNAPIDPSVVLATLRVSPERWLGLSEGTKIRKLQEAFNEFTLRNAGMTRTIVATNVYARSLVPTGIPVIAKVALGSALLYGSYRFLTRDKRA